MSSLSIQRAGETQRFVQDLDQANGFFDRFFGLMGRSDYPENKGLLFPKCSSVHMYFMKMPIDIVFLKTLDAVTFEVMSVHQSVKPWRMLPLSDWSADAVLEVAAGLTTQTRVQKGDLLCIG